MNKDQNPSTKQPNEPTDPAPTGGIGDQFHAGRLIAFGIVAALIILGAILLRSYV